MAEGASAASGSLPAERPLDPAPREPRADLTEADRAECVLLCAPEDRVDALLQPARVRVAPCPTVGELACRLREGAGAAVLAEELLTETAVATLAAARADEPPWSDFPFLVLAAADHPPGRLEALGNVVILERPVRGPALVSAVQAALRARRRQYQARDQLAEQARVEQARHESDARFRQIADNLPAGFLYEVLEEGPGRVRFAYVSAGAERLVGVTPADLMADPLVLYRRVLPEDLPRLRAAEEAAGHARSAFDCQFRTYGPGDVVRWLHCRSSPRPQPDGTVVWDGIAVDITERVRAEQQLRDSEEQFHRLADSLPQLTWMARPDGHIDWYNRRWYDYTGTTPEQMEGWGWQSVHDPAELPRVLERWRAALQRGEPWEDTFPLRRHDGQMRWHLSRALPLKDDAGQVVRWFGTNTDITEHKEMEAALRAADRRKDEFLAILAHELRNPLAPIRNAVHIMRLLDPPGDDLAWARDVIDRQTQQLSRLVDDLLDISRINRGKVELRKQRVALAEVLSRAVETVRPLIESRGHALEISLPPAPVALEADPTRLAQVVGNLLTNAAKYTPEGGRIVLAAAPEDAQVVVRVRDNGVGIPADMLGRVFELFTQVDQSLARAEGGLGIGLTLVKSLVEQHGGTVAAYSDGPGRGSEFVLRLPLVRV